MAENIENEEELTAYEKLTNTQKCAILMMLLGEDEAAEILKNLFLVFASLFSAVNIEKLFLLVC